MNIKSKDKIIPIATETGVEMTAIPERFIDTPSVKNGFFYAWYGYQGKEFLCLKGENSLCMVAITGSDKSLHCLYYADDFTWYPYELRQASASELDKAIDRYELQFGSGSYLEMLQEKPIEFSNKDFDISG